jgi:anti-sigma B factor antagonist
MTKIKISNYEKYTLMQLEGNFNSEDDSEKIRETFREVSKNENPLVLVDLKGVDYLNSASLGSFLSGNAIVKKSGGKMVLFNSNDYLDNIFNITKLNLTLPICHTLEEAKAVLDSEN